jgi:DNA sulfur modification protein DndD
VQRDIDALPEADPRIAMQSKLYLGLRSIFERSVGTFRDRLRQDVEAKASEIFKDLTTEPDYSALRINDRYGLTLVDENGREIIERSAGAEQVVALSLIGALNRVATREGPLVMDTPFGRLDTQHRANILRFVPRLGTQALLLVQSGELDRTRDLAAISGKVARQYELVRDGSPTRSRIERVV